MTVRAALEVALNSISPAISTAWQNQAFTPPAVSTPFQEVYIMPAEPENLEYGGAYREQGVLQVTLRYPLQAGPSAAETRAELIRSTFARGNSFTSGSSRITITRTASIGSGYNDGDRWTVIVRVRYHSERIAP